MTTLALVVPESDPIPGGEYDAATESVSLVATLHGPRLRFRFELIEHPGTFVSAITPMSFVPGSPAYDIVSAIVVRALPPLEAVLADNLAGVMCRVWVSTDLDGWSRVESVAPPLGLERAPIKGIDN